MDLITGLAVIAGVCMLSAALVAVLASKGPSAQQIGAELQALAGRVLATVVVVFFITAANLLLIAQQTSLALGTFVVGILLVVVLYLEPSLGGGKRPVEGGKEDWRR